MYKGPAAHMTALPGMPSYLHRLGQEQVYTDFIHQEEKFMEKHMPALAEFPRELSKDGKFAFVRHPTYVRVDVLPKPSLQASASEPALSAAPDAAPASAAGVSAVGSVRSRATSRGRALSAAQSRGGSMRSAAQSVLSGAQSAAIQAAAKQALSASGALAAVEAAKLGADGQPLEEKKKREKKAPRYVKVDMRPINWWPVTLPSHPLGNKASAQRCGELLTGYADRRGGSLEWMAPTE